MFKEQLEYVMDIFLWVWQVELHHGWAPLTRHWAEWTPPFLTRWPRGLWIQGTPELQFQKWRRINSRQTISRPNLKRKTYKCHSLSFLPGFLTIVMSFWSIPPKWQKHNPFQRVTSGEKLPYVASWSLLSFPPPTTYTLDKFSRQKFLKDTKYSRYFTLCKDSL